MSNTATPIDETQVDQEEVNSNQVEKDSTTGVEGAKQLGDNSQDDPERSLKGSEAYEDMQTSNEQEVEKELTLEEIAQYNSFIEWLQSLFKKEDNTALDSSERAQADSNNSEDVRGVEEDHKFFQLLNDLPNEATEVVADSPPPSSDGM